MKTVISTLFLLSIFTIELQAQMEIIIGIGSTGVSDQSLLKERTSSVYRSLTPHDPKKAMLETRQYRYDYNIVSRRGIQYELGIGNTVKTNSNFSIKYAAIVTASSFSFLPNTVTSDYEVLGSELVDFQWPDLGSSTSYCNETIISDDYTNLQNKEKLINVYSINLSLGAEYYINLIKLSVGTDIFLRTPINTSEEFFVSDFKRENVDGLNICTYDGHIDNRRISDASNLNIGIAPYLAYQISERLRIKVGVRNLLGDTFHQTEEFSYFSPLRSYNALETSLQVSYTFGNLDKSVDQE